MTQDKVMKFNHPNLPLPPDLSKPCKELDDYLSSLKESPEMSQRRQIRYAKMARTRQINALENGVKEVIIDERSAAICSNSLEDSSIIVEKRVGYKVTCPHCCYSWTWFGKKDRFFVSCSRCHKSFKLNWK